MAAEATLPEKKPRSLFDLPADFFDSCILLRSHPSAIASQPPPPSSANGGGDSAGREADAPRPPSEPPPAAVSRLTCNTCGAEFESLQEQREHFKSDLHRLNVKLSIAGKGTIKEEDFDEAASDSVFHDFEISSVSGSEDEFDDGHAHGLSIKGREEFRKKLYFRLHSGDTVALWRCLLLNELEEVSFDSNKSSPMGSVGPTTYVEEDEMLNRVKHLICEPRDKTHLRIVLLTSGGHFAGCVFDGNSIIAHKTFHRYVVRAKAGKKQSGKDATGKVVHSAGSSLRRHNEAALKKEVQELIVSWKSYFDSCRCAFIYAPSKNRQMLFDGEKTQSILQGCDTRNVPLTVHRPTLKEAKRIYNHLTHVSYEMEFTGTEEVLPHAGNEKSFEQHIEANQVKHLDTDESICGAYSGVDSSSNCEVTTVSFPEIETTPLHEASKSGDAQRTLMLLEQGLDPCIKDARGKTPYMLASEKEVRNTFRRFMSLNLDKWDWRAADVPSALTKEMEESQAAKQAEKDAKRKAKAKELKKLKKAKEKAKAQASQSQIGPKDASPGQTAVPVPALKQKPQSSRPVAISKEEERQWKLAEEREKRAAAAERRLAALSAQSASTSAVAPERSQHNGGQDDTTCSCCNASLAGKVPFHRYNYKYCSTTCMHVHREMLEND